MGLWPIYRTFFLVRYTSQKRLFWCMSCPLCETCFWLFHIANVHCTIIHWISILLTFSPYFSTSKILTIKSANLNIKYKEMFRCTRQCFVQFTRFLCMRIRCTRQCFVRYMRFRCRKCPVYKTSFFLFHILYMPCIPDILSCILVSVVCNVWYTKQGFGCFVLRTSDVWGLTVIWSFIKKTIS